MAVPPRPPLRPLSRNINRVPPPSDPRALEATPFAVLSTAPLIEHLFVSTKDPGIDSTLVQPNNWNDAHSMKLPASSVVGRDSTGAGPAQCLPIDASGTGDALHIPTTEYIQQLIDDAVAGLGSFEVGDICASIRATKVGWMLLDGSTIGPTISSAFHADDQLHDLFIMLWHLNGDTWPVTPNRGTSAEFAWANNYIMALPDARGRVVGMPTSGTTVNLLLDKMGVGVGEEKHTLQNDELPTHAHPTGSVVPGFQGNSSAGGPLNFMVNGTGGATGNIGLYVPHNNVQPTIGANLFIKF
jgi:hypothetical protein